jgi:hypothetical protein
MDSDSKVLVCFFAAMVLIFVAAVTGDVLKSKSKTELINQLEKDGYKLSK